MREIFTQKNIVFILLFTTSNIHESFFLHACLFFSFFFYLYYLLYITC